MPVWVKAFLLPNGFLDGGVTGIALLLNATFGWKVSIVLVALSVPFLVLAYCTVSRSIVFRSIISILGLAVSIQLETFDIITDDKLLIAIFGGLFVGLGIEILVRSFLSLAKPYNIVIDITLEAAKRAIINEPQFVSDES